MSDTKFKAGELKEIILAAIGISVVLGGSIFISPNFPIVMGGLIKIVEELKKMKIPKTKIKRVLKNMEKKKILSLEKQGNNVIVRIIDNENTNIMRYSIKALLDFKKKKKKWERKWFLVLFDVPEEEKNKRNFLRKFLLDIGFYQYQKSVYAYPYECKEEVNLIKKIVEGGKYIRYIVAERLEGESNLKTYFRINE